VTNDTDETSYPTSNALVTNVRDSFLFARSGSTEFFVHSSDFVDGKFGQARQGDAIAAEIFDGPKGKRGRNVRLTEAAAGALA
jgi:cold shock CspA family protein